MVETEITIASCERKEAKNPPHKEYWQIVDAVGTKYTLHEKDILIHLAIGKTVVLEVVESNGYNNIRGWIRDGVATAPNPSQQTIPEEVIVPEELVHPKEITRPTPVAVDKDKKIEAMCLTKCVFGGAEGVVAEKQVLETYNFFLQEL